MKKSEPEFAAPANTACSFTTNRNRRVFEKENFRWLRRAAADDVDGIEGKMDVLDQPDCAVEAQWLKRLCWNRCTKMWNHT
jgi:hypothetical protein